MITEQQHDWKIKNYCIFFLLQLAFCYPDKAARREVSELEVQCSNQKYGCSWVGKLGDFIKVLCYAGWHACNTTEPVNLDGAW